MSIILGSEASEGRGAVNFSPREESAVRSDVSAEQLQPLRGGVDFAQLYSDRVISSDDLFDGRREIAIAHAGSVYRLKITRQGKLILNK